MDLLSVDRYKHSTVVLVVSEVRTLGTWDKCFLLKSKAIYCIYKKKKNSCHVCPKTRFRQKHILAKPFL